jgi:hypothetical protein
MKWSDCAIQDLRKYKYLKASLENIPERMEALRCRLVSIKGAATDKVPVKGVSSRYEDNLIDIIVEKERLKYLYRANKTLLGLIERGLASLDKTERLVLDRFYIDRPKGHVEKLMEELNYEKSRVYEIKDQALYKFTIAMYGIVEY